MKKSSKQSDGINNDEIDNAFSYSVLQTSRTKSSTQYKHSNSPQANKIKVVGQKSDLSRRRSFQKKKLSKPLFSDDSNDQQEEDNGKVKSNLGKDLFGRCKYSKSDFCTQNLKGQMLLFTLQELLHREYILLEKQQYEKMRLKKQIQAETQKYYSLMIDSDNSLQSSHYISQRISQKRRKYIVKEDGFDNCYNFIKDVVVNASRFYRVGFLLLMKCNLDQKSENISNQLVFDASKSNTIINDQSKTSQYFISKSISLCDYKQLVKLCVNVIYQRIQETDPYLKEITKMICLLMQKIPKFQFQLMSNQSNDLNSKNNIQTNNQRSHDKIINFQIQKFISLSDLQNLYSRQIQSKIQPNLSQKIQDITNLEKIPIRTDFQKVSYIFSEYMQKESIKSYFQVISNRMLKKLENIAFICAFNNKIQSTDNKYTLKKQQSFRQRSTKSNTCNHIVSPYSNSNQKNVSSFLSGSHLDDTSFQLQSKSSNFSSSFQFDPQQSSWLQSSHSFQSITQQKKSLATTFLASIYQEADLAPNCLKIPLKYLYQSYKKFYQSNSQSEQNISDFNNIDSVVNIKKICSLKVWELIQPYYLKVFHPDYSKNALLNSMNKEQRQNLKDIHQIVQKFLKIKKRRQSKGNIQSLLQTNKNSLIFIVKVVQKLLSVNDQKYSNFIETLHSDFSQNKDQQNKQPTVSQKITIQPLRNRNIVSSPQKQSKNNQNQFIFQSTKKQFHGSQKKQQTTQLVLPPQLIKIFGGCLSLKQLYILLSALRLVKDEIPNDRIVNRICRIFDMSPNLCFLFPQKPEQCQLKHVILTELQYHTLIQQDYKKLYQAEYQNDRVKSIIRQVICELRLNELQKKIKRGELINKQRKFSRDLEFDQNQNRVGMMIMKKQKQNFNKNNNNFGKTSSTNVFANLLKKISQSLNTSLMIPIELKNMNIQSLKKIKYLLWLFQQKHVNQSIILSQMLGNVRIRMNKMTELFEHTKFGLLAVIGNIRHYKNLLISKKQSRQKIQLRIITIQKAQNLPLSLCLSSPHSRNNPLFSSNNIHTSQEHVQQDSNELQAKSVRSSFSKYDIKKITIQESPTLSYQQTKLQSQVDDKSNSTDTSTLNKHRYRLSNADDIIIQSTDQCLHRDNMFLGLSYHCCSIKQFIQMFCKLKEVSECIYFASFIINQKTYHSVSKEILQIATVYSQKKTQPNILNFQTLRPILPRQSNNYYYFSKEFNTSKYKRIGFSLDKIGRAMHLFIDIIFHKINQASKSRNQQVQLKRILRDIIFRQVHSKLVKKRGKTYTSKSYSPVQMDNEFINVNNAQKNENTNQKRYNNEDDHINYGQGKKSSFIDRCSKNSKFKRQKNADIQSTQNSLIYQSKTDQILLYQIRKLKASYNSDYLVKSSTVSQSLAQSKPQQLVMHIKQIQQTCARFFRRINEKQSPQKKMEFLKNITDIYRLVIDREGSSSKYSKKHTLKQQISKILMPSIENYSLSKLIFQSILLAQPPNLITNMAFIEVFLTQEQLLSKQGKLLNEIKQIIRQIFTINVNQNTTEARNKKINSQNQTRDKKKHQSSQSVFKDGQLKMKIEMIRRNSTTNKQI